MAKQAFLTMLLLVGIRSDVAAAPGGESQMGFAIPMQTVQAALEAEIPRNIERLGANEFHGNVGIRYGAWRGPISVVATGAGIRIAARIEFAAQGCLRVKKPWPLRGYLCQALGSCGFGDEPRAVVDISVDVTAAWTADWSVSGSATTQSTTVQRCNVSLLNIDATTLAVGVLRTRFEEQASRIRDRLRLRPLVESAWSQIAPLPLGSDRWLVPTLRGVRVQPLRFQPTEIASAGTIEFDVSIVTSATPPPVPAIQRTLVP